MSSDLETRPARPLSPHLLIYRPQITSILSITHRAAGAALSVGTVLLAAWLIAAASGPDAFAAMGNFMASWLGRLLLFGWSVALFFHLLNGIRHLFWDGGYGFEIKTVHLTGWLVVAATAVMTVLAWSIGLAAVAGHS